jgi:hypothetical protein
MELLRSLPLSKDFFTGNQVEKQIKLVSDILGYHA